MAGLVARTDILEDKDGKSRGMGTVTFDTPLEAVQAVCILLLVKVDFIFSLPLYTLITSSFSKSLVCFPK